ncbi:hypothetical protein M3Y99_00828200 [Aphelenchoides fujianensis]|nr:hypothetical protein M3Y99_00828200 [Aphelenchoides fujianensis]
MRETRQHYEDARAEDFRMIRHAATARLRLSSRGYTGGGVYLVSREGARVFNEIMQNETICPDFHRAEEDEDEELARCMARAGIYPTNTRDAEGRDRFHHFHFPEEISDTSVSFHHLSPYEILVTDYLTSRLKLKSLGLSTENFRCPRNVFLCTLVDEFDLNL